MLEAGQSSLAWKEFSVAFDEFNERRRKLHSELGFESEETGQTGVVAPCFYSVHV